MKRFKRGTRSLSRCRSTLHRRECQTGTKEGQSGRGRMQQWPSANTGTGRWHEMKCRSQHSQTRAHYPCKTRGYGVLVPASHGMFEHHMTGKRTGYAADFMHSNATEMQICVEFKIECLWSSIRGDVTQQLASLASVSACASSFDIIPHCRFETGITFHMNGRQRILLSPTDRPIACCD
ncbi:hypothetical protein EJ04DRAFT_53612 [Polyplosphaeria fusca]|uniref:Uncharacterized protein n=1 Tax=Polyplosphaeria fusca TaxID=682080 RepID=A0A9P4V578_9PLEO|nr:hypothetical protein EJ04DRAFT_53612 [Polyplosphaeria fusca]